MEHDPVAGAEGASEARWPLRIFVMSQHLVVRAGLTMFICPENDLDLIGESGADASALPLLEACAPDVVILDLDDDNGLDLFAMVLRTVPSARLLALMAARNAPRHHALIRGGSAGLLLKEAPVQVVLKQLRQCRRNQSPSPDPSPGARVIHMSRTPDVHQRRIAGLSGREREIVSLIGEGLRNDQVAVRLGIAEKTVRNQLSSLFDKLGVNDRLGLAVYAFEHGLLRTPQ